MQYIRKMSTSALQQAKAALRKDLKQRLAGMSAEDRVAQSDIICQKLLQMPEYTSSQRVCLYLHMKEEVHTSAIMKNIFHTGKECYIPQYIGPVMTMVKLKSLEDFESLPETKWKIRQPADDDVRPDALSTGGLDLILMPGLGFTPAGARIGRGKGYYDKYLQRCADQGFQPKTIGLAYKQQICDDIPLSENDMKIDFVLYPD